MDPTPLLYIGRFPPLFPVFVRFKTNHCWRYLSVTLLPQWPFPSSLRALMVPVGHPKSGEVRIGVNLSTTALLRHVMAPDIIPSMIFCQLHDGCLHVVTVISKFGRKITNPLIGSCSSTDPNWHSCCCSQQRDQQYG